MNTRLLTISETPNKKSYYICAVASKSGLFLTIFFNCIQINLQESKVINLGKCKVLLLGASEK